MLSHTELPSSVAEKEALSPRPSLHVVPQESLETHTAGFARMLTADIADTRHEIEKEEDPGKRERVAEQERNLVRLFEPDESIASLRFHTVRTVTTEDNQTFHYRQTVIVNNPDALVNAQETEEINLIPRELAPDVRTVNLRLFESHPLPVPPTTTPVEIFHAA